MKHRIGCASETHLGGGGKGQLHNTGKITPTIKEMLDSAIKDYFDYWGGVDFDITDDYVKFGYEPAYQYEEGLIISICRNKDYSWIQYLKAWGAYGTGLAEKFMLYKDYKKKAKFIKFVDKYHDKLFPTKG